VHSMVEYVDGSVIAQLATPDMRLPIAYALGLPVRLAQDWGRLSLSEPLSLSFAPPDRKAFPALDLAYEAGRRGDAAPAWLSAANEVAVAAFLAESIRWSDIVAVATSVLDAYDDAPITSLASLLDSDARARALAGAAVAKLRS
jgi:1-deoxy-D-xylulose-5-phosphate reductoisomerase